MTNILALDPGTTHSAFVWMDGREIFDKGIVRNEDLLDTIETLRSPIVCEMLACQGMPVGAETFETAYWIGRYMQRAEQLALTWHRVYRSEVKLALCGTQRAKDSNIRQAILDLYGGTEAVGKKKTPGPLYGITSHMWSALAVGITFQRYFF